MTQAGAGLCSQRQRNFRVKAGWAKTIFVSPNPHAEASVTVKDAQSGNLVFAYNVDKSNAVRALFLFMGSLLADLS